MRATTRPRARATATATATATVDDNPYSALLSVSFSDSDADSVSTTPSLPETDSDISNDNQEEYQTRVIKDCRALEKQLRYYQKETDSDNDRESDDEEETMIITPEALKALCSSTLSRLHQDDTVQIRSVRRFIINGLMRVTCETHDHGHAFILEDKEPFQLRMGDPEAELPEAPTQPSKDLGGTYTKNSIRN